MGSVLKGLITNEGLQQTIKAASNEGWHIYPTGFGISDILGDIELSRSMLNLNPTWYEAPISARNVIDASTIEFICDIPPGVTAEPKLISEVYIFAKNEDNTDFLLGINGISGTAMYDPGGSTILKIHINIQNVDLRELYIFKYTQAMEIDEHNRDPNAHPELQERIEALESGKTGGGNVKSDSLLYWGNLW